MKLIIHAPTEAALGRAKRNLKNLLAADGGTEVVLVLNGAAAVAWVHNPDPECLRHIVLCENSLAAAQLSTRVSERTTPAAIQYIMQRQHEGWAYFRS